MNPAYENNLDQQFLMQATQYIKPTGMIACILPTTNLAGKQSQAFRQKLCSVINVHRADLLPTNTFRAITTNLSKKMILATAVLYLSPMPMDHAIITRQLNGTKFTWIDDPCSGDDIRLYYDNVGKEIWEICSKYHTKFDTSVNANYTRQILSGPNVNIGAKTEQQYLGDSLKLQHLSGAKIWTGKDVDPNGTYQRVYEHAAKSRTGKRFVYKTKTPEQTINLGRWMDSKLFGILLSMTGTDSNVSKTTVGQIPFVVLDGVFDTDQDFTHAVYLELGISNETHIRWINEFGN